MRFVVPVTAPWRVQSPPQRPERARRIIRAARATYPEFRWENGYTEPEHVDGLPPLICFDRSQYDQELGTALDLVAELPHDEAEHRGRRFLWPWQWGWRLPPRE